MLDGEVSRRLEPDRLWCGVNTFAVENCTNAVEGIGEKVVSCVTVVLSWK